MNKESILVVPGTGQYVKNYGYYNGLDIWMHGDLKIPAAECLIGHSLGGSFILSENIDVNKRYIFINPLVKKRNKMDLFVRWIKFHLYEGIKKEKVVPIKYWVQNFGQAWNLLKVEVIEQMKKIPRENIVVIRGKKDDFYCDKEDIEILKKIILKLLKLKLATIGMKMWLRRLKRLLAPTLNEN